MSNEIYYKEKIHMDLQDWLKLNNTSITDFSKKSGLGRVTVWRACRKQHRPNIETTKKIVQATNGKVNFFDLLSESERGQ